MTATVNLRQRLGDTWIFDAECNTEDGAPVDLTGASLTFALTGTTLSVGDGTGITIVSAAAGTALITVPPEVQAAAGITRGFYPYTFRIVLVDGTVSTQATGGLSVA